MNLPENYKWLETADIPKELEIALSFYGLKEFDGAMDNPIILGWAKFVGVFGWYAHDSIPWCGLFKGNCAKLAGWLDKAKYDLLSALSWLAWGTVVEKDQAMLGDTLVFNRPGGAHVTYYIGEDQTAFCCYGGNQSDSCDFTWILKDRLMGVRRAPWKISQPLGVKKVYLERDGSLSTNEA